jgi:transglutaminase-like putative cysteine protease
MIYDIRQVTTYRYASSVAYARHVLRLTPIDRPGQRVHASAVDVEPAPIARAPTSSATA